ncbi:MAG: hypothetical protein EBY17_28900 [Acidobacteriia bacterium]|nr:hypothetical protein [Terriglobia bacterium]
MSFSPRPYQIGAADWLSTKRRAILSSPAGSGKTLTTTMALDKVIRSRHRTAPVRIGWMANTKEQCQQAQTAINTFPLVAKQDVAIACAAAGRSWADRDVLVVDEMHHSTAPSWKAQIETAPKGRWGMTATLPEDLQQMAVLAELFGPTYTITREQVAANLTPAVVRWLNATDPLLTQPIDAEIDRLVKIRRRWWSGDEGQLWGQVAWQVCVEKGIVGNRVRNEAAIAAASNDKPTLVLINQVEHANVLAERIPGARPCYSAIGAKARREVLADFLSGKCRCLVASSLCDEGFDAPNAEVLVLVSAGKSNARTEQRTGRVLRTFAGKSSAIIYDFKDLYHPLPAKHARLRRELYTKLNYHQIDV